MVGAPYDQADAGRTHLYYGNAWRGLVMRPRQVRVNSSAPVAPLGKSDSDDGVQLSLTGRTPLGRDKVKLQWQVAPLGTYFTAATGVISGTTSWTDALPGGVTLTQQVTGLQPETSYHWRARLLYRPNRLGQSASRWIHVPWNGWNETDFRTPPPIVVRTITYTYDSLYRLTQADYSTGEAFAYAYDAVGNRKAMTTTTSLSGTLVTTYTYDIANRLTDREVSDSRAYTYTWSNRGQLLAEYTLGYPVRTFAYDAAGQMITATVFTLTTHFTYNGDGARVAVSVEGHGATTYTLDYAAGYRILAESTGVTTTLYLYGHECLGELRDDEWLYYLTDGTGYVRQGVNAQGQVVSAWLFDPDGTVLVGPEGPVSHLVCGGVYDWSTGLIYKNGRYFDPMLGLWLALAPLAVLQLWQRRKRKGHGGPWDALLVATLVAGVGVTVTACGGGPGATITREAAKSVCFEVPDLTSLTVEFTGVDVFPGENGEILSLGMEHSQVHGAKFTAEIDVSERVEIPGEFQWVQLINEHRTRVHQNNAVEQRSTGGAYWLDNSDPYARQQIDFRGHQSIKDGLWDGDSPREYLTGQNTPGDLTRVTVDDKYQLFAVWRVAGCVRVALGEIDWGWKAASVRNPQSNDPNRQWMLDPASPPVTSVGQAKISDDITMPTWPNTVSQNNPPWQFVH